MASMLVVLFALFALQSQQVFGASLNGGQYSESDLRKDLFKDYDKLVRPVKDASKAIPLALSIAPLAIRRYDEIGHFVEMESWVMVAWQDDYLKWDPQQYGGITNLNLPCSEVWKPDMSLYSTYEAEGLVPKMNTNVIANHTGQVIWVPPFTIRSTTTQEKFDESTGQYTFTIKMGSWTYSDNKVELSIYKDKVDLQDFADTNPRWTLVSATAEKKSKKYPCCVENYSNIDFNFTLAART